MDEGLLGWIEERIGYHVKSFQRWYRRIKLQDWTLALDQVGQGQVDSNGNCTIRVYANKTQRRIVIGRIILWADGVTPNNPHNAGNNEWAAIYGGPGNPNPPKTFLPLSKNGQMFPNEADYSGHNALRFDSNEDVYFVLTGSSLTANTNVSVRIFGGLEPTSDDLDF